MARADLKTQSHRDTKAQRKQASKKSFVGLLSLYPTSEDQLQRKLNDAIVAGLQSAVAADIVDDLPKVG